MAGAMAKRVAKGDRSELGAAIKAANEQASKHAASMDRVELDMKGWREPVLRGQAIQRQAYEGIELRPLRIEKLSLEIRPFEGYTELHAFVWVPEVGNESNLIPVKSQMAVDANTSQASLAKTAYELMLGVLEHELKEHFFVDGAHYEEPHPK